MPWMYTVIVFFSSGGEKSGNEGRTTEEKTNMSEDQIVALLSRRVGEGPGEEGEAKEWRVDRGIMAAGCPPMAWGL